MHEGKREEVGLSQPGAVGRPQHRAIEPIDVRGEGEVGDIRGADRCCLHKLPVRQLVEEDIEEEKPALYLYYA